MSDQTDDPLRIITFGCRLNAYESEVMRGHARDGASDGRTIVFNTCAVTAEAERQARQAIRRARREDPEARIVVTGCAAQIRPEAWADMPEVDAVLGNEDKLKADRFAAALATTPNRLAPSAPVAAAGPDFVGATEPARIFVDDIMAVRETAGHLVEGLDGRARAFVQVQNGCDHRCTFCIIPYGRGNSRSVPLGEVVAQVRELAARGYAEVVLTGVDITSYGADLPGRPSLGNLVRRVLKLVPDLPRLRLSSIDSAEIDPDLMQALAEEPRLMPHLHLSLQAGDDMVLKRMKRRHNRAQAIAFAEAVRRIRPDVVFGADLIAGFPTETDEMFANSLKLVEEMGLVHLHVFPYSARTGTPAARMPQVPVAVRRERARALREAGAAGLRGWLKTQIGTELPILLETADTGRSEGFALVRLATPVDPALVGGIVTARITAADDETLAGVILPHHAADHSRPHDHTRIDAAGRATA
ncbi:tRNA (N(6)-L-threonylcarbamoyladenosine(37)-C(2))-methylthiotransferase MtaB [Tistrella mobilis]|uniref:tRNA (N(6)-L-threonylcarbamoyladenosine(37)-C(2))-methylthiotransferase MtaB n=1 Tax=Tistrella mobilis TaxID=171437 RepID=A0A161R7P6_9PROT|nr:tRNA (N(6)-L-threonylcarbamoyladenosine(37)-C(2))-methylthiotransferase MtaB [Tistrella mobilis]KYO57077.1 tRNA (N(6)-L-threonylcarbamoyladenosine(37)-C(2))-methylthiotransferase MtaB [Tistrella mobilis]